jgi:hypothetical protein
LKRAIQKALPDLKLEIGQHPNAIEVASQRLRNLLENFLAKTTARGAWKIHF